MEPEEDELSKGDIQILDEVPDVKAIRDINESIHDSGDDENPRKDDAGP